MTPLSLKRMRAGLVILGIISVVGVFGYWLAGWSLLDSIYMVVVTLSTVGYKEVGEMTPALQIFTCLVIIVLATGIKPSPSGESFRFFC
jgi:voltage-gated potassium channel